MDYLNLQAFEQTPLVTDPFEYVIVPGFIKADALPGLFADYPAIEKPGSFPISQVRPGARFSALLDELNGPAFARGVEEKFSVDLRGRPTLFTVRGVCRKKDGQIHTDTESKIITVLIYLNPTWDATGGRLRLLRSPRLEDVAAEVPPDAGTLLVFKRSDNSYHGHEPFEGRRQVIQMNWVTAQKFVDQQLARHTVSSWIKKVLPFR